MIHDDKIDKQENGCWLWTGAISGGTGYGGCTVNGKKQGAHRAMYTHLVGPIPEGLDLDHLCRVRHCVNPDHLEPVTRSENLRRSPLISLNHREKKKTHCKNGHPFSEENTGIRPNGNRWCRECNRQHSRNYKKRLRKHLEPSNKP